MAVDGVNNSNSNTGAYVTGAALLGGGIGATVGHATKSILKEGNYTDEFVNQVHKNIMNSDKGKAVVDVCSLDTNSKTFLNDALQMFKKNYKVFGIDVSELQEVETAMKNNPIAIPQVDAFRKQVSDLVADVRCNLAMNTGEILDFGKDTNVSNIIKRNIPKDLDEVFDRSKNVFKNSVDDKEMLEFAKSARRNLKLKAAGIYGAIGAGVLGIGAYLFNKFSNNS